MEYLRNIQLDWLKFKYKLLEIPENKDSYFIGEIHRKSYSKSRVWLCSAQLVSNILFPIFFVVLIHWQNLLKFDLYDQKGNEQWSKIEENKNGFSCLYVLYRKGNRIWQGKRLFSVLDNGIRCNLHHPAEIQMQRRICPI